MKKEEICVFIENEAQLKQARKILKRNGEKIDYQFFEINENKDFNYLKFYKVHNDWFLGPERENQIQLSELESVLRAESESIICDFADKYQELFNHMSQEHSLTLTISEMNEIITLAIKTQNKLNND